MPKTRPIHTIEAQGIRLRISPAFLSTKGGMSTRTTVSIGTILAFMPVRSPVAQSRTVSTKQNSVHFSLARMGPISLRASFAKLTSSFLAFSLSTGG